MSTSAGHILSVSPETEVLNPNPPRSQAVSATERDELFADFRREADRREREEKRQRKAAKSAAFRELLLATPGIKARTASCTHCAGA